MQNAEMHEDRRHEPPDLAVEDVVEAVVVYLGLPGRRSWSKSSSARTTSRGLLSGDCCRKKTITQTDDQGDGQGPPAQAGIGPQVGDLAIVLAELLVELLLAAADRLGGSTALR